MTSKLIRIFADGACSGNPGPGGWGAIVWTPTEEIIELGAAAKNTTNNKMELTAVGKALRAVEAVPGGVVVYTDSMYVIEGASAWAKGWEKNGWKKSDGSPVANKEFWVRLREIMKARTDEIQFVHVRGHAGNPANERCDEIATSFAQGKSVHLFSGPRVRYATDLARSL